MKSFWRAGLILFSTAALGGVAIAVWNRKTIASIHGSAVEDPSVPGRKAENEQFE